jgi:hypothetical protein
VRNATRGLCEALLTVLAVALSAASGSACGGAPESHSLQDGVTDTVAERSSTSDAGARAPTTGCTTPAEGCPCGQEGATVECQGPKIHIGDYTSCLPGKRFCVDGEWTLCVAKTLYPAPDAGAHPRR